MKKLCCPQGLILNLLSPMRYHNSLLRMIAQCLRLYRGPQHSLTYCAVNLEYSATVPHQKSQKLPMLRCCVRCTNSCIAKSCSL